MTPGQAVGYMMNQTSAITNVVSTRIYHGMRTHSTPTAGSVLIPCINYYEMAGGKRNMGMEMTTFTINCRAATASTALQVARLVVDLFHGTSSSGMYGDSNGFGIARSSLKQIHGLLYEQADNLYNVPVDVLVVYPSSSVT